MDNRIAAAELTPDRRKTCVFYARDIIANYGKHGARKRLAEIKPGILSKDAGEGNRAFYGLLEELIEEALTKGTIDGGPLK